MEIRKGPQRTSHGRSPQDSVVLCQFVRVDNHLAVRIEFALIAIVLAIVSIVLPVLVLCVRACSSP
jgi:hypothetical protein